MSEWYPCLECIRTVSGIKICMSSRMTDDEVPKILLLSTKINFLKQDLPQQQIYKLSLRNLLRDRHLDGIYKPIYIPNSL